MGAIILVGAVFVVVALVGVAVVLAACRSWARVRVVVAVTVAIVLSYVAALLVVSVATPPRNLATGEWKCFDDWCSTVTSVTRAGDDVTVTLSVRNQGRREQAPDSPHVWLVDDGGRDEVLVPFLTSRVPGGSVRALPQLRLYSPVSGHPSLVVTEGGAPSRLVIGDENSFFHRHFGWPLS